MRFLLALGIAWLAGCGTKQCAERQTDVTPGGVIYRWNKCSDDEPRTLACELAGKEVACTCTQGGKAGKTFKVPARGSMVGTDLVTPEQAREGCDWSFTP